MKVHVTNGVVDATGLPQKGYVNGCFVSNYNLLDEQTLRSEGWLPLEHDTPTYTDNEMLQHESYEVLADKVVAHYTVVDKPEPIPQAPTTEERIEALELALLEVVLGG